jgi:arabinogalactan oligomer/maltooligosaccharide transport system substrate-binding protein
MYRITKFLPLAMVLALVLAACGNGASPSASTSGSAPASMEESTAPSATEAAYPEGDFTIELWTKEGDPNIDFVQKLADDYTALHSNVTFNVVNKDVEVLREDMVNTALSPDAQPQLLWTVADHVGPFTAAGVIQPLDGLIDESKYDPVAWSATLADGKQWSAPISNGNQLMLYYNKSIVGDQPPADSDAMIQVAKDNTSGDNYGLVFNQTESFWLVPFLGGFGGSVFADDGVTPTLDTPEMRDALQFMYDLKFTDKVMPSECDYDCAHALFKDGTAAMIINGDWALAEYADTLGDNLGVAPIPEISATGEMPKPYTAGTFYMVPSSVEGDMLTVVTDFINWSTDKEQQVAMVETLKRLPANADALADPIVTDDPLLAGAAEAVKAGVPQPTNVEMRCNFDAMTAAIRDVFGGNSDIAGVATTMQTAADNCVATLE